MSTLQELSELPVSEKIQLLEDLWDTVVATPEQVHLTEAQKSELDHRIERADADPEGGVEWAVLKERLLKAL